MVAAAIAASQVDHLIDVVENPTLSENGVHYEWGRHAANGQAVRTDRFIEMVCRLPPTAAVHVLHHNGGISGDILPEKRNKGLVRISPTPPGALLSTMITVFPWKKEVCGKATVTMKRSSSNAPREIWRNTADLEVSRLICTSRNMRTPASRDPTGKPR